MFYIKNINEYMYYSNKSNTKPFGIVSFFLCCFIFTASWSSAFRFFDWLPIYYIFLYLGLAIFVFKRILLRQYKIPKLVIYREEWLMIVFFFLALLNIFFLYNNKGFIYFIAYVQVFLVGLLFTRSVILSELSLKSLLNANTYGIIFLAVFICVEFILDVSFNFEIQSLLPTYKEESTAFVTVGVPRALGLATEPTQIGFYLCCLAPIAIWHIHNNFNIKPIKKNFYTVLIFLSLIFTFAGAAFLIVIVTSLIFVIFVLSSRLKFKFIRNALIIISILAIYITSNESLSEIVGSIFITIWDKITFSGGGASSSQRVTYLLIGIERIIENPFLGVGLGYTSTLDEMSSINWYVFLASEIGLITALILYLYMFIHLIRISLFKTKSRIPLLFGAFAGSAYLGTLSTFFYPNLWILYIIFAKIHQEETKTLRIKNDKSS